MARKAQQREITSVDVTNFAAGLDRRSEKDVPLNGFYKGKDVMLTSTGHLVPRDKLVPFLPDTVETTYQKASIRWQGQVYFFTLDAGKAKFCKEGDTSWTDCGGTNSFTTNNGGYPKFIRVLDNVMVLNGKNGDKIATIDLTTAGFPVKKYSLVTDPTTAPTAALTNLTTGAFKIYYGYTWSGTFGETAVSPILTQSINVVRDQWQTQTSKASVKISRPAGTPPTGATYWNLYVALASTAGTIQPDDMLQLAMKLDLATTDFVDDGTLSINLGSVPPIVNSTDGPRVSNGIVEDGNPILFQDEDNPYNIWIGGGGPYALSFSVADGGYRAEPEKGTNFYPTAIVGFRTGQGIPALTVLYSNTEGLAKQSVLQQQTVNYGDQSFTVWGITEQHYGAAGVASPNSPINYNGKLLFMSTDGILSAQTQPSLQNVISITNISTPVDDLIRSIKNSAMPAVIGAGWNNRYMWLIPSAGFDTPQQILVLDTNPGIKGVEGNGAFYTLDIPAQWIGVVSPEDAPAFVYISQGKKTLKLMDSDSTYDTINGLNVPFSTGATGGLMGFGGPAHNNWQANVQVMFDVTDLVGDITVGVTYRNQTGKLKMKKKVYKGPSFAPSVVGGYGDTGWSYGASGPSLASAPAIKDTGSVTARVDKRIPLHIDEIMNEAQWFYSQTGFSYARLRSVSYEGIGLGVRPDLQ